MVGLKQNILVSINNGVQLIIFSFHFIFSICFQIKHFYYYFSFFSFLYFIFDLWTSVIAVDLKQTVQVDKDLQIRAYYAGHVSFTNFLCLDTIIAAIFVDIVF